jgi:predicted O-methyltransferase YrrM
MNYQNPRIPSSYQYFDLGKIIYETTLNRKPLKVIEFGCYKGYSTVCLAMALKTLGQGKIKCYDLWDKYQYNHTSMGDTLENIKSYELSDYVDFIQMDFNDWLKNPEEFDLMHVDVANTGDVIKNLYDATKDQIEKGSIILFEGGSKERDQTDWMIKYGMTPMNSVKSYTKYEVLSEYFPSISIIKK